MRIKETILDIISLIIAIVVAFLICVMLWGMVYVTALIIEYIKTM